LEQPIYQTLQLPIATAAKDYVLRLFKAEPKPQHLYHSYQHTCEVVTICERIAHSLKLSSADTDILLAAAWLHDVGYLYIYHDHETKSKELAADFLAQNKVGKIASDLVLSCIEATRMGVMPKHLLEEILHDADLGYSIGEDFLLRSNLLRMEWQLVLGKIYTDGEWRDAQIKFLSESTRFYTAFGQLHFAPLAAEYLSEYSQQKAKKIADKKKKQNQKAELASQKTNKKAKKEANDAALHPFERIEKNTPVRGVQSFFRSVYPNHLELSSIADNKANMMISINSIVLTLIIALYSVGIGSTQELKASFYVLPIALFILTALSSLVIAVLSVMPKVTKLNKDKNISLEAKAKNIIFFGNFVDMSVQEYEQIMQDVFNDSRLLYGNMTRDLYYLGLVLQRKYRLLSLSYTVFLAGLTISVIAFLVTAFL
jgi:HD superfamily phosphodiesterase